MRINEKVLAFDRQNLTKRRKRVAKKVERLARILAFILSKLARLAF
ncbi:MAG: hypothetical protein LUC43_05015 [Burkholderiales bacterium]|nr:hypothetical protein [Burkholderiales bacterium]